MSVKSILNEMLRTYHGYQLKMVAKSWFLQNREEQKLRLESIIQLSVELDKIRQISSFSTVLLGHTAIESIIQGDWGMVEQVMEWCAFPDEDEELQQRYVPIWANFRLILEAVVNREKAFANGSPSN